jgi:hypothetical protein
MEQSASIAELAKALAKAQSEMGSAITDSTNPFFKSKYADLASVIGSSRPFLAKNGLSVTQLTDSGDNGHIRIWTQLMHESGEWIRSKLDMKPQKPGPQELGSCITYARRYAYASMVGVYQEDDDGNKGQGLVKGRHVAPPAPIRSPRQLKLAELCKQHNWAPNKAVGYMFEIAQKSKVDDLDESQFEDLCATITENPGQ